jgi:hypothetical protein
MMGFSTSHERQVRAYAAQREPIAEPEDAKATERRKMAMKIVMAVVDRVVNDIVRPGPKPEERECYEMANELRAITPELEALVTEIINVNNGIQ